MWRRIAALVVRRQVDRQNTQRRGGMSTGWGSVTAAEVA